MRFCSKCYSCKDESEFYKEKRTLCGLATWCKECDKKFMKKWHTPERRKKVARKYNQANKLKNKTYKDKWKKDRAEVHLKQTREYSKKYQLVQKIRYHNEPLYKLTCLLRGRVGEVLKLKGIGKTNKSVELLGVSFDVAKAHIERQFKKGMSWNNWGNRAGKWHIDHKIPLASAKTEEELKKLFHYTNLQPLWSNENMAKGKKIVPTQTSLTI